MGKFNPLRAREADSVAVIGLGRFGQSLAMELMTTGTEVMGIDNDEDIVQELNGSLTQVVRADATRPEVLHQLAVNEFDRAVVAIGTDIQSSILTCSALLRMEIPMIWAKAVDDRHGLILEQLGVHHVVYPEKDMGRRVAHLVRGAAIDYMEIDPGYALVKTATPAMLDGVRLGDSDLRTRYGITVTAFQHGGTWINADADTVLTRGEKILILGTTHRAESFAQLR